MKRILLLLTVLGAAGTNPATAQIDIEGTSASRTAEFREPLKPEQANADYFSLARYRAERAAIRKERNYLEFAAALQGTLTSYNDAWIATSGGDNSIAAIATIHLLHNFKKERFEIETKFDGKFGYNRMKVENDSGSEGIWFKNQDEFSVSTAPSYRFSKNWSLGSIIKFRSQFANGYVSRTEQRAVHRKSKFMTPGYLDISLGFTYNVPKERFPLKINLSPLALSATFAENDWIRRQQLDASGTEIKPPYAYGIEDPDKTSKWEGGSSIQLDFDRTFGKNGWLRYRTTLFSFFGWITDIGQRNKIRNFDRYKEAYTNWETGDQSIKTKPVLPIHPTVRWENTLEIKATKYISTILNFQLYYNRAQNLQVQTQTLLSVGLSYTFKNKDKK